MQVKLRKIGMLDEADFEIGNITLICGENNTGKTYATYSLYGYLNFIQSRSPLAIIRKILDKFDTQNNTITLDNFLNLINQCLESMAQYFLQRLPEVFSGTEEDFQNSDFKIDSASITKQELIDFLTLIIQENELPIKIENETITILSNARFENPTTLLVLIIYSIYSKKFPRVFILSAERTGVSMFQKELDVNKNEIIRELQRVDGRDIASKTLDILRNRTSRYPSPVQENIYFVRDLQEISKKTSFIKKGEKSNQLYHQILDVLHQVINGKYIISQEGIYFAPEARHRATKGKISMQRASSSVRSLLMLNFYILHQAQQGDILMIDEPELNLHPKNQILLARLFALLANAGIKIFITTHSDYIVRELNNCIMLYNLDETQINKIQQGYHSNHKLNAKEIKAYLATKNKKTKTNFLQPIEINQKQGIYMETFDDPIETQNENQGLIFEEVLRNLE